jgi:hypothetical protein
MIDREALRRQIRAAFGPVPFPEHCGLRAAMLIDDWVCDPALLARVTAERDIHAPWWEIPRGELRACTLAICYLDAAGTEFYLPAYMTLSLDDMADVLGIRSQVFAFLNPDPGFPEPEPASSGSFREHFRGKFSRIGGAKRRACVRFLEFWKHRLDAADPYSGFHSVTHILRHEFWAP